MQGHVSAPRTDPDEARTRHSLAEPGRVPTQVGPRLPAVGGPEELARQFELCVLGPANGRPGQLGLAPTESDGDLRPQVPVETGRVPRRPRERVDDDQLATRGVEGD